MDSENRCDICGREPLKLLFSATDWNRRVDRREFKVVQCPTCRTGYTFPRLSPELLQSYYPREYYSIDVNLRMERNPSSRRQREQTLRRIRRFRSSGLLLDIGCGTGMFLKTAREFGFTTEGLETSTEAGLFGRSQWGLNIIQGNFHEVHYPPHSYEIVTLLHVFEHLQNPIDIASRLFHLLKHNGILVVAVPNFSSLQAQIFRDRWFHLDVPRHLFHFSPSNLRTVLETTGFRFLGSTFFSVQHNWAGILGSVIDLIQPNESLPHKVFRKTIGRPIAQGLAHLEASIGRGGTFELMMIKP